MTGGSGGGGSSPRGNDGSSKMNRNSNSESSSPPPPHFNEYLAGSPFRGLARSASDVGLDNASSGRNGDACARSNAAAAASASAADSPGDDADQYNDGSARRKSVGVESAAAAVDESLLVSPILADYAGDANGSSGSGNGKKSKPRTSQSPRAAAAKAFSLQDVDEESANARNNEADDEDNTVPTADLANASVAASITAADAAPEPISLGAHLQLDTSMCPSLGLGSIGSDEDGEDEEDGGDNDGSTRNIAEFGAQLDGEPEIPDTIGTFEADGTADVEDKSEGEEDTAPSESGLDVSEKEKKTANQEFNVTEEAGPIQNKADGDSSPTDETVPVESSMDYCADSAAAHFAEAPVVMGENRQDEGGAQLGQGVAAARNTSTSTSTLDEAPDQHESSKVDSGQLDFPQPISTTNREPGGSDSTFNDASDQIVNKNGALRDTGDMGRKPLGAPAVDDPLKFSLSPIARNSSSSPLGLARSPKVDLDSCSVDNTKNEEAQMLEPDAQPATKEARETASDEADQTPNDNDVSAHSTTHVRQVVEAPIGTSNDALPASAATDTSPTEDSPNINTMNAQVPEKADSNESINEEEVLSHIDSSLSLLQHATSPPSNVPSLKFGSPEGDNISPPLTEPEMYDSALASSSAASNGNLLNPLPSPTTGTPLASGDEPPESSPTIDLSSAKKKLGASSHALVERLRGAAQKRKLLVTRSRDSFVAKEQRQKLSLENAALSMHTEEEEEVYEPETPEPIKPIAQRRHFEGINPVREFKARPLPATTGDLGGGGQAGVPKVSKRSPTVPSSPLLGNRRRLKEGSVGESKAYQKVKEEERRRREISVSNTVSKKSLQKDDSLVPFKARPLPATTGDLGHGGQTGVPKVTKRTPTVPSSPLLGHRRPTGNSHPSRAYQAIAKKKEMPKTTSASSAAKAKAAPSVKPSALRAQSFERLLSGSDASRAKENALNEKRERQEAEARRKSSFRARPLPATSGSVASRNHSPELVGLDLLTSTQKGSGENGPYSYPGEENETPSNETPPSAESPPKKQRIGSSLPDRLHSTKRAKERAQYDELRLSCDRERQQREVKARNRIIQETKAELDELKDQI